MNLFQNGSDIRGILLDVLMQMPRGCGHREAVLRLLWQIAAGPIIAGHTEMSPTKREGKITIKVDDTRWIAEIRSSAGIIIERINGMLDDLECPEYCIRSLDIGTGRQKAPESKPASVSQTEIPEYILKKVEPMSEATRREFLGWYQVVRKDQSGN